MHILLFILAFIAFIVYSTKRNKPLKEEPIPPPRLADWQVATSQTVNWQDLFIARCESPAETGFLKAIIPAYQLIPDKGTLKGGGLELQLQIPIGRYRVDFLANNHLVFEIDGAAYHSSPEAIENDRIRDGLLAKSGYVILRIPAKIVFNSPTEAVQRVRSAISNLAHERSIRAQESFSDELQAYVDPRAAELAKKRKEIEDWVGEDPRKKELYEQALAELMAVLNQKSYNEELQAYVESRAAELAKKRKEIEDWVGEDPRNKELYEQALAELMAVLK